MSGLTGDEPDLELGTFGEGVMLLQVRLYALGIYQQVPNGTYDMYTESAVRDLQSQLGQTNDGVVTRDTWEALYHQELQAGIQYQYPSPYDALTQIRYDLDHAGDANLSDDGQWQWDGTEWQPVGDAAQAGDGYAGQLSADGQWRWDGTDWQPADASAAAGGGDGPLSDDGQWRWDGTDWQPAAGAADYSGYAGLLSDDGQWRWNGSSWEAA